jgi:hypothetical protein
MEPIIVMTKTLRILNPKSSIEILRFFENPIFRVSMRETSHIIYYSTSLQVQNAIGTKLTMIFFESGTKVGDDDDDGFYLALDLYWSFCTL